MQRHIAPRHRVTEWTLAGEDTKERVHNRSRILWERGGWGGGEQMEREQQSGVRCAEGPEVRRPAAGRDVVRIRVGIKGALLGNGRHKCDESRSVEILSIAIFNPHELCCFPKQG
jgi:hypothetical protein